MHFLKFVNSSRSYARKHKCISKTQTRHTGVHSPEGGYCAVTYIFRKLSSSSCLAVIDITLRLTVFEIFAVKWPQFSPKISHLGIHWGSTWNFTPIGATVAEISVNGGRRENSNQYSLVGVFYRSNYIQNRPNSQPVGCNARVFVSPCSQSDNENIAQYV